MVLALVNPQTNTAETVEAVLGTGVLMPVTIHGNDILVHPLVMPRVVVHTLVVLVVGVEVTRRRVEHVGEITTTMVVRNPVGVRIPLERILVGEVVVIIEIHLGGEDDVAHVVAVNVDEGRCVSAPGPDGLVGVDMAPLFEFLDEDTLHQFVLVITGVLSLRDTDIGVRVASEYLREDYATGHDWSVRTVPQCEVGRLRRDTRVEPPMLGCRVSDRRHLHARAEVSFATVRAVIDCLEVVVHMENDVGGNLR